MRFGPVPVAQAEGAILAHSLQAGSARLRKGRVLTPEDCAELAAAGHAHVTVARLDPDDISEDAAATQIAAALVPAPRAVGLRLTTAAKGRVNVYATGPGVLKLDVAAIEAGNLVDPMITVATLPNWARTRDRTMVATVKIIAYGVAASAVDAAAKRLGKAMQRRPVQMKTATLIETTIAGVDETKGQAAIAARLATLGMSLDQVTTVPHATAPLSQAISNAKGDVVLILTASATSDPADVAPEAVRRAGGSVARVGIPVDPGNLLFLGDLSGRPVIGLPGCARSPALNGADWVLERIVCGITLTDKDLAGMGVGGLLKESAARGLPREAKKTRN